MKSQTEGIVLISRDGYYLNSRGDLPTRPEWDKTFLLWKVKGKRILCSENTKATLPKSIISASQSISTNPEEPWDINLGIDTFKHVPDIFYLCKSPLYMSDRKSKRLRLDFLSEHSVVLDTKEIAIYARNDNEQ